MSAYIIVQVRVHHADAYADYRARVPPTLEPYGGKFIVRGGQVETLEGDWSPERFVILEFPNVERAKAWHASPEYQSVAAIRYQNATSQMIVVEGLN